MANVGKFHFNLLKLLANCAHGVTDTVVFGARVYSCLSCRTLPVTGERGGGHPHMHRSTAGADSVRLAGRHAPLLDSEVTLRAI